MAEFEILRRKEGRSGDFFSPDFPPKTVMADGPVQAAKAAGGEDGELILVRFPQGGGVTPYRFKARSVLDIERVQL
jgi:hypothetical protein